MYFLSKPRFIYTAILIETRNPITILYHDSQAAMVEMSAAVEQSNDNPLTDSCEHIKGNFWSTYISKLACCKLITQP